MALSLSGSPIRTFWGSREREKFTFPLPEKEREREMADQTEPLDVEFVRSRIDELSGVLRNAPEFPLLSPSDSEIVLQECVQSLEAQVEQIVLEHLDVQFFKEDDLSLCLEKLAAEVKIIEAENDELCNEVEQLKQTHMECACQLEGELESLNYAFNNVKPLGLEEGKYVELVDGSSHDENCKLSKTHGEQNFQELDLKYQTERSSATLEALQDLDHMLKKYEAIEKIEESFSGLKVIEFEGNYIKLSLKTFIPSVEGLMHHQKLRDSVEHSELNHELQIEVMNGSLELKNVEIFPNDVCIGDILEATKSFSQIALLQTSSSLRWFLQKVQDRIVMCSLRQYMVKIANRSRHLLEYSDRDELIMARIRGIDAFIKPSQGWPLSTSVLKLISLKPSDHDAEEISLRLLCEIEEHANSLDIDVRRNITSFIDAIEEIIAQKLRHELHTNM